MKEAIERTRLEHFVSVEALKNEEVTALIKRAGELKRGAAPQYAGTKYAVNLFFESSTRTHKSFEMAENKLGVKVIDFEPSTSSLTKGESLYDTVLTMAAIGVDVAVIRHGSESFYTELINSPTISCSIINGGDGAGQHPSQCLLDLMTIYEEFGSFEGLKVAIVGDLTHSRVARSNMQMLQRLGAEIYFSGPPEWYNPSFDQYGQYRPLDELVKIVDVMMLLRVQHERHETYGNFSTASYLEKYGLTADRERNMLGHAIIMHPAPVNHDVELQSTLMECPRSRIVTQMQNGVYARMAVLEAVLAH
ncbi:aspartate carbamoyltransferase catalytic subunit [Carnobacterium sp.]|uniref:aspartate carbamoyltransferase catalytic subunit n=1 Tax=Carnobacterium sp. TaxID=48221 RepID=UPI0028A7D1E3|nr:aspartate carbamoyltransferase catalytic subunit [Carnobacterium sp.]